MTNEEALAKAYDESLKRADIEKEILDEGYNGVKGMVASNSRYDSETAIKTAYNDCLWCYNRFLLMPTQMASSIAYMTACLIILKEALSLKEKSYNIYEKAFEDIRRYFTANGLYAFDEDLDALAELIKKEKRENESDS